MAIKLDEARIRLLKVGPSLVLRSDNEGGNIRIYAPNSNTNCYEWDAYNGNLRLYYSTNSGNGAAASWLFLNDGAIQCAKFKGPLEGNADSASKFNANKTIALTGAVTGSASSTGASGWSITATIANKGITSTNFTTTFRTQTKGDANSGAYLTVIRNDSTDSWGYMPIYGSGIAFGRSDTHTYLYTNYNSALAYIGGGNANKLNWIKRIAFTDGTGASGDWGINITGSAAKLTTPRAINGTNFDGSAAITTAHWGTARTLTIGNKGQSVNGSGNISWSLHDILYSGTIGSTSSWDITNPGTYHVAPASNSTAYSGTGNPETNTLNNGTLYRWGQLIVSRANTGGLAQFYISHQDSTKDNIYGIHFRTGWNGSYIGTWRVLLDSVNYTNWCDGRYINTSGDTLTGALNFKNGTWNNIGDDAAMGDCNQAGMFGIKGLNGATGIYFTPYSGSTAQKISINGSGTMTITGTVASTFSGNLTGNVSGSSGSCTGNAATASKWLTARTITHAGDLKGSFSLDGSGNVTNTAYLPYLTCARNNSNTTYAYHRIMHCSTTSAWTDTSALIFIHGGYQGGGFGIAKISFRSNDISTQNGALEIKWLVRSELAANCLQGGFYWTAGSSYADIYYYSTGAYTGTVIRVLQNARAGMSNAWQLINSAATGSGASGTNTSNAEVYTGINYRTYTATVTTGTDYGHVNSAASANSVAWGNVTGKPSTYTPSSHTHSYLPLTGGSISGNVSFSAATSGTSPTAQRISINGVNNDSTVANAPGIGFHIGGLNWGSLKFQSDGSFRFYNDTCTGYKPIYGDKVYGAVWNDYAEFRWVLNHPDTDEPIESGRCVAENGNDSMSLTHDRLQAGARIISDTYGMCMGETEKAKTPIAVCGRVLAYPFERKVAFNVGDPVCSGPNGTVSKMSREEAMMYPERIVGTVVSKPTYKEWGPNKIPVKGRIWIQVR